MAQAIASGQRLNLAVLVLTCLYRFLSEVVTDEEPGKRQLGGPPPYLFGWLGLSFFLREEKVRVPNLGTANYVLEVFNISCTPIELYS